MPLRIKIRQAVERIRLAEHAAIEVCVVDDHRAVGIENSPDQWVDLIPGRGISHRDVVNPVDVCCIRRYYVRRTNQGVKQDAAGTVNDRDVYDLRELAQPRRFRIEEDDVGFLEYPSCPVLRFGTLVSDSDTPG